MIAAQQLYPQTAKRKSFYFEVSRLVDKVLEIQKPILLPNYVTLTAMTFCRDDVQ